MTFLEKLVVCLSGLWPTGPAAWQSSAYSFFFERKYAATLRSHRLPVRPLFAIRHTAGTHATDPSTAEDVTKITEGSLPTSAGQSNMVCL